MISRGCRHCLFENPSPGPHRISASSCAYPFPLELNIRVNHGVPCHKQNRNKAEPQRKGPEEDSHNGYDAGDLEEPATHSVRLFPDLFTAHGPGSTDPYEPVRLCMVEQEPYINEERPEKGRDDDIGTYLDPNAPEEYLHLDDRKKQGKDENESFVVGLELPVILTQGVNPRYQEEECRERDHDQGNYRSTPESREVPVHLAGGVPVRWDLIGKGRVDYGCDRQGQEEHSYNA